MGKQLELLDLVSKEKLDEILGAVNEACGIGSVIADTTGRPISSESNFSDFCKSYCRATEEGRRKCYSSDAYGGRLALTLKEPYVYDCHNSGLVDCASPIIVDGHHLANLNGGQVLEEPIPETEAIARAQAIGIEDIDGYLQALKKIPKVSRRKLRKIVNLMSIITQTISEMAMQKALIEKQSKEYLNVLINSVSDCIISIDANHRIMTYNAACLDVFGYSELEFHGRPFLDLFDNGEAIRSCCAKLGDGSLFNSRIEMLGRRISGDLFPVQLSISRVNRETNDSPSYVTVLRDITEEKRNEKMKDDLLSMLTHDMRNPVVAISKTFELLRSGRLGQINENQEKIMRLAVNTNNELGDMVGSFLDIFRQDNGQFRLNKQVCDIDDVIQACIEDLSLIAEERQITLDFAFDGSIPKRIACDVFRMKRAISNIISNALHYSPRSGTITVKTFRISGCDEDYAPNVPVRHLKFFDPDKTYLVLVVADNGFGIPEEFQEEVFKKFFTIKTEDGFGRRGIGLGLAFCKLVAEAHEGLIFCRTPTGIETRNGRSGIEFHLVFPEDQETIHHYPMSGHIGPTAERTAPGRR